MKILFIALTFIISTCTYTQTLSESELKALIPQFNQGDESDLDYVKRLAKEIRNSRDQLKPYLEIEVDKRSMDREMEVCVECEKLIALTKDVNEILEEHALLYPDKEDLLLESKNLSAIATYIEVINEDGNRSCIRGNNIDHTKEFRTINESDLILVFAQRGKFEELQSFRFDNSQREVTYFRGEGSDINKLVKVELMANGDSTVSYYKIKNSEGVLPYNDDVFKKQLESLPELNSVAFKAKKAPSTSRSDGVLDGEIFNDEWQGEASHTRARIGPSVEYKDYLPRELTVVDVENEYRPADTTTIQSDVIISSRKQRARTTMINDLGDGDRLENTLEIGASKQRVGVNYYDGDGHGIKSRLTLKSSSQEFELDVVDPKDFPYVRTRLKSDGEYAVGVPYSASAGRVDVQGEVAHSSSGSSRLDLGVSYDGSHLVDTIYINSESEEMIIISKDKVLEDKSRVSFKFKSREDKNSGELNNSVWLTYFKRI